MPRSAFYDPPAEVPDRPGTLIRTQDAEFFLDPEVLGKSLRYGCEIFAVVSAQAIGAAARLDRPVKLGRCHVFLSTSYLP